jgi:predicted nucleic acid-binding Zn ribbon protein
MTHLGSSGDPFRGQRSERERGPEPLGDILARLFVSRGWGRKSERLRLEAAWQATIEPSWRDNTRVLALRRGVLEIEVKTATLLQELSQFHRRRLLAALRQALPGLTINDLRFRAGAW